MASPVKTTVNLPQHTDSEQSPFFAWIERHQKPLTYGVIGLAVLLLGGWLYLETGKRKELAGNDALDRARGAFESGNLPAASAEFQRIAQSFRGSVAGFHAELAMNEVRLASGQAQLMMGGALENLKKFAEAAAAYSRAAQVATEPYRQVEALLGAARANRLAGKQTEALEILRGIIANYPKDTPGAAEAEVRLAEWTAGKM